MPVKTEFVPSLGFRICCAPSSLCYPTTNLFVFLRNFVGMGRSIQEKLVHILLGGQNFLLLNACRFR